MEKYSFLEFLIDSPVYLISDTVITKTEADKELPPVVTESSTKSEEGKVSYKKVIAYSSTNTKDLEFLGKILQAVKVNMDDAFICESPEYLPENIVSNTIIYFGNFPEVGSLDLYAPVSDSEKIFLRADNLADIQNDVNKKKQLWTSLQKVFKV